RQYRTRSTLDLAGRLSPLAGRPSTYRFHLRQRTGDGQSDPTVRGTFDLAQQRFAATLDHFRFTDQQRYLLPPSVRWHWNRLDPSGALPRVAVRYRPHDGLHAEAVVEDVALTLAVDELDARLSQVSGRLTFDDQALHFEQITGRLGGVDYRVDGTLEDFDIAAPLDITVRAEPFTVPEGRAFLDVLPPELRGHYARFEPTGRFAFHVRLHRDEAGGPLRYEGAVDILEAKGRYHKFPFPVHDAHGRVRFTHEQAVVEQIVGRGPDGGTVCLEGTVTPPGVGAAVDMTVTAENVQVGDPLIDAMEPKHRRVMRTFFNETRYNQLLERGVIRRPGDEADEDESATDNPPAFALGGRVNAHIRIERAYGRDKDTRVTTRLRSTDARLVFEHWPYPMQVVGGSLTVAPDHVVVDDLQVRGLTGAEGRVRGRITHDDGLNPALTVTDLRLPIDALLIASLPEPQDRWVQRLHADGMITATGRVHPNDEGGVGFTFDGRLDEVTATPFDGRFTLTDLSGALHLEDDAIAFSDVVGHRDEAQLAAEGRIAWSDDGVQHDLRFTGENLPIEPALLDLLPPDHETRARLAAAFKKHQPEGALDAALTVRNGDGADGLAHALTLQPRALAFDLDGRRIALRDMSGTALVQGQTVTVEQLHGAFEGGEATVSGKMALGEERDAALRIDASVAQPNAAARMLLPKRWREAVERLRLQGAYELTDGRLRWRPDTDDARPLTFHGKVRLRDAGLRLGVDVTDLQGAMDVAYASPRGAVGQVIELGLSADRLRIADRLVEPATVRVRSDADDPGRLRITTLRGRIYDGVITGDGVLALAGDGAYRLDMTMQGARVRPLLQPDEAEAATADRGRMDASLHIEGAYDDPTDRRGRGALRVHDAELFERPLTLALLQTANLTLPTAGAFDRATVRYMLDGEMVHLEDIRFEAPTFAVIGAGTLELPTRALALTLVARNPGSGAFGAVSDMINVFKDELVAIKVDGTLASPKARMVSMEGLRTSWDRLFSERPGGGAPREGP
ncbi:MAG: AsmA-like C-terminal region-containing protein, partial [Phycisphaeraceae bacterium]